MAVRDLNGSTDKLVCSIGAASGMTYGTMAAIVKFDTIASDRAVGHLHQTGNTWVAALLQCGSGSTWVAHDGTTSCDSGISISTGVWYLAVYRKATGTTTPRWSVYNFNSTTWTHGNGGNTLINHASPGASGDIQFSYQNNTSDIFDGQIAARALWSNSLPWTADASGDTAIQNAGLHTAASSWLSNNPTAFWLFNQASTSTAVEDLSTSGTADQSSITGTTVVTGSDPSGFDFSLGTPADANQALLRPLVAPVPRLMRDGVLAPLQLMGDRATPSSGVDATVTATAIVTAAGMPAPTIQTGSTVAAIAVAAPVAMPAPVVQTGSTVAATAIVTTTAMSAPTIVTATVAPGATIVTTTAMPAPVVQTGSTVTATAIVTTTAMPAPTVSVQTVVTPPAIVTTTAMLAPAIQTGSTVAATAVSTTTAMPAPAIVASSAVDPYQAGPQIAWMFTQPSAASFQLRGDTTTAVAGNVTVTPPVIATTTAMGAPAVQTGSTVAGVVVATVTALPAPAVQTGSTVSGTTIATVTAMPAPSISAGGSATASATSIATVTALPVPSLQTGSRVNPPVVATVTAITAPTITAQTVISPPVIATVTALPAPTIKTGSTVSGTAIATVTVIPVPTIFGTASGIRGQGHGKGSRAAGGSAYPPASNTDGNAYPRSSGNIIGQVG
jgi:hypothetical protein